MKVLSLSIARDVLLSIAKGSAVKEVLESMPGMSRAKFYREVEKSRHLQLAFSLAQELARWNKLFLELPDEEYQDVIDEMRSLLEYHLENFGWMEIDRPLKIGKETKFTSEWAREKNIPIFAVEQRIDFLGWSPERTLTVQYLGSLSIAAFGETHTAEVWWKRKKVWVDLIVDRILEKNWIPEDAVSLPRQGNRGHQIHTLAVGEKISTLQLALLSRKSKKTVDQWSRAGLSPEEIIKRKANRGEQPFTVYGVTKWASEWEKINHNENQGVNRPLMLRRRNELKWSDEEAVLVPLNRKPIVIDGVVGWYEYWVRWGKEHNPGLTKEIIIQRRYRGDSWKKAVQKKVRRSPKRG